MTVIIEEAGAQDAPAIAALVRELAESEGEPRAGSEAHVAQYLAFPGNHVLLAEEDGQPIGLLSYSIRPNLWHAGNVALIEELVVHYDRRGHGVGSALMSELLSRVAAAGCIEVSVSTGLDNEGARRFYRSHGFTDEFVYLERHFA